RVQDALGVGQLEVLICRRRVRDVEAGHAAHGRGQEMKAAFGDAGGDLRGNAGESARFGDDDRASRGLDSVTHGRIVERHRATYVHYLQVPAFAGGKIGRFQSRVHAGAVADERGV